MRVTMPLHHYDIAMLPVYVTAMITLSFMFATLHYAAYALFSPDAAMMPIAIAAMPAPRRHAGACCYMLCRADMLCACYARAMPMRARDVVSLP